MAARVGVWVAFQEFCVPDEHCRLSVNHSTPDRGNIRAAKAADHAPASSPAFSQYEISSLAVAELVQSSALRGLPKALTTSATGTSLTGSAYSSVGSSRSQVSLMSAMRRRTVRTEQPINSAISCSEQFCIFRMAMPQSRARSLTPARSTRSR